MGRPSLERLGGNLAGTGLTRPVDPAPAVRTQFDAGRGDDPPHRFIYDTNSTPVVGHWDLNHFTYGLFVRGGQAQMLCELQRWEEF